MNLSPCYHRSGAVLRLPDLESIHLTHNDLEVLKSALDRALRISHAQLLREQFREQPTQVIQHGDAVNGLFVFCGMPLNYDSYGFNEEGNSWLYSFCRPDDFGNLVPADPFYHGSEDEQFTIF